MFICLFVCLCIYIFIVIKDVLLTVTLSQDTFHSLSVKCIKDIDVKTAM